MVSSSRARMGALLLTCVAAVAVGCCLLLDQGSAPTELMRLGALTSMQQAAAADTVEGGSRFAIRNPRIKQPMFRERRTSRPAVKRSDMVHPSASEERSGRNPPARVLTHNDQRAINDKASSSFESSFEGHGQAREHHVAERSSEGDKFRSELDDAARKSQVLTDRDSATQTSADQRADALLAGYNSAVNEGVNAYSKISAHVDDETARAFGGKARPAAVASRAPTQSQAAAQSTTTAKTAQGVKDPTKVGDRAQPCSVLHLAA